MGSQLSVITDEISQDFDHALDVAQEFGIDAVEVRSVWNTNFSLLSSEDLEQMRATLQDHKMKISVLSSPFAKCFLPGSKLASGKGQSLGKNPAFNLGLFDHLIELSDFLKTDYIRIFAFYKTHLSVTQDKWQEVISQLHPYIQKAEKLNKILVLENEHVCYADNISRTLQLLEELSSPAFKLNLDPGNFFSAHDEIRPEAYDIFYQRNLVAHMHIKDPFLFVPIVGSFFGVVGEGKIDYKKLVQQAHDHNYKGFYSLETHCVKNKEETSRKSLKNLRKFLDELGIA